MAPLIFSNGTHASPGAVNGTNPTSSNAINGEPNINGPLNGPNISTSENNGTLNGASSMNSTPVSCPVALVGMSCKFGGEAANASKFWDLCIAGKDSWGPIPQSRFNAEALYHPDPQKIGRVRTTLQDSQFEACANATSFTAPRERWTLSPGRHGSF